jgi:hypothetical protein
VRTRQLGTRKETSSDWEDCFERSSNSEFQIQELWPVSRALKP